MLEYVVVYKNFISNTFDYTHTKKLLSDKIIK